MNTINANVAWKLSDCKINNSDVDFFVKLVHVDRYKDGNDSRKLSRTQKRSKSVSVNRNRESPNGKYSDNQKSRQGTTFAPMNILHSISVWNQTRRTNKKTFISSKPIDVSKYRSLYSHSQQIPQLNQSKRGTKHQRNYTQQINNQERQHHHSTKLQFPTNKSFEVQSNFTQMVLKTEPNQFSPLKDVSHISRSNKKQTIKQLVEYRKEKVLRKKDYQMKKFKATLNKAKFSSFHLQTQTS